MVCKVWSQTLDQISKLVLLMKCVIPFKIVLYTFTHLEDDDLTSSILQYLDTWNCTLTKWVYHKLAWGIIQNAWMLV